MASATRPLRLRQTARLLRMTSVSGRLAPSTPFPVEQHLTEDLERLVHLIVPAQAGTNGYREPSVVH